MSEIGCGSHSCRIARPTGMGTNGPCTCWQRVVPLEREIERLRAALRKISADSSIHVAEAIYIAREALGDANL
jgi:hypothetical protein